MERSIMTGVRVKMISSGTKSENLETDVNKALEELENSKANIIDVQYAPMLSQFAGGSMYVCHFAMIKYYPG